MDTLSIILNLTSLLIPMVTIGIGYGKQQQQIKSNEENIKRIEQDLEKFEKDSKEENISRQELVVALAEVRVEVKQLIEAVRILQSRISRKK